MSSFTGNAPNNTTMIDFRSAINTLGGPAKNCRFAVRILPGGPNNFLNQFSGSNSILRDLTYLSESVEFPGRSFDYIESRYYGPSQMRPVNTKYTQECTISIITRQEAYERQLFDDWLEIINPSNNFDLNYPETYECSIEIYQLSDYPSPQEIAAANGQSPKKGKASYMWKLWDAWPLTVNPQTVTWADDEVLRLNISFAYRYWSRPGRDSTPNSSIPYTYGQQNRSTR